MLGATWNTPWYLDWSVKTPCRDRTSGSDKTTVTIVARGTRVAATEQEEAWPDDLGLEGGGGISEKLAEQEETFCLIFWVGVTHCAASQLCRQLCPSSHLQRRMPGTPAALASARGGPDNCVWPHSLCPAGSPADGANFHCTQSWSV